jgi:hypothetical protein
MFQNPNSSPTDKKVRALDNIESIEMFYIFIMVEPSPLKDIPNSFGWLRTLALPIAYLIKVKNCSFR